MLEKTPGIRRLTIPMGGGLDEISAVTDVSIEDFIEFENWRLSRDGKRIQKRYGIGTIKSDFGEDIYGLGSYVDKDDDFCLIAVTEGGISRKIGANAWGEIHTFANISHPVKILEIQGKQFIITEIDGRMIHTDEADYQIGIDEPTTIMELHPDYDTTIDEDACAAGDFGDWTEDNGAGGGDVDQTAFDGNSCYRLRGSTTGGGADHNAEIEQELASAPGKRFKIEMSLYFDKLQHASTELFRYQLCYTATRCFYFSSDGYRLSMDNINANRAGNVGIELVEDKWYDLQFFIDTEDSTVDVYITPDGGSRAYYGNYTLTSSGAFTAGDTVIYVAGHHQDTIVYVDYINIYETADADTAGGTYRYAVKYARSGNFGCESNPIKSYIGADIQYGTGLDDLTPGGSYTGNRNRTIQVEIDGTTPDTIKISYDGGITWHSELVRLATTMYLNYGITLTWAAITGHTSGDFWSFNCQAMTCRKSPDEKTVITSIPVSGDAQVDQRKLYRSVVDGANFYWLLNVEDNVGTTFEELVADTALGLTMDEKCYSFEELPSGTGKFSVWWDNRLWVSGDNIVYYSEIGVPEEFDIDANGRTITIRMGDQQDKITGMEEYGDNLYVFKRNSVFIIQKKAGGVYGRFKIMDGIGCMAGWSIVKVNNLMMWLSDRGIELFNGSDVYAEDLSVKVLRTLDDIEKNKLDYISSAHFREFNEVIWSLPDRGSSAAIFVVYNTLKNKFYRFSCWKEASCLDVIEDSGGALRLSVGTRDGAYGEMNPSTTVYHDWGAVVITATARKGQINLGGGSHIHAMEIEFESVDNKDMTLNVYRDMDKDVYYTTTLTGVTPHATDRELRRPIKHFAPFGGEETRYINYEIISADDTHTAGDCKINRVDFFFVPKIIKKTQEPD